jgi:3-methyladenine DNA glycosylase AlkD
MLYEQILSELSVIPNLKTKDIDAYSKKLIKSGTDVSKIRDYILIHKRLHRIYFQVSLGLMGDVAQQISFIEDNEDYLQDWWHVDQLTQFVRKPIDFEFAFDKAKGYIASNKPFTRRWGYVLFLTGLQKNHENTNQILLLMKDDEEYYVQMAEAWLICDLAVFNPKDTIAFIESCGLSYSILGKAIQKIVDSYRISDEDKEYVKLLRGKLKNSINHDL